jgi:hypothetical protein
MPILQVSRPLRMIIMVGRAPQLRLGFLWLDKILLSFQSQLLGYLISQFPAGVGAFFGYILIQ